MKKLLALAVTITCCMPVVGSADDYAVPDNVAPAAAPDQPLPFSHKRHSSVGLDCARCHTNPEPGAQMTYPATETCLTCHQLVATEKASIVELLAYAEAGDDIPWQRVYAITPGVTWSHRAHLDAGARCETCHGDVSATDVLAETTAVTAMATCIDCHAANSAPTACITCHAWPDDELLGIDPLTSSHEE